jgi:hypothetical protein
MIPKSMPSDLFRGWEPVFGKDHAQTKRRQLVNGAVIKPRREFAIRLPMINGRKLAAS